MKASQIHTGSGTSVHCTDFGQSISSRAERREWRHPWWVQVTWNTRQRRWVATVKPGFVNGQCPIVRTTVSEQSDNVRDFGTNPLTGRRFFSDRVFDQQKNVSGDAQRVNVPLYLQPSIQLGWRAVGFDSLNDEAVPPFLLDRGAAERPRSDDGANARVDPSPRIPRSLRLLRACDLWIHLPRLALTSSIEFHEGLATGISNASQTLGLRSPAPDDTLRVMSGTLRPVEGLDALARIYEEPAYDELLIATIYLLSPPGAGLHSAAAESWTPYVRHNLFWNLQHVTPSFHQLGGSPEIPFIPPLAGGAAQIVINFLTASINDILQDALNLVTAHSMAGIFYTATGGGHDAKLPAISPTQRGTGLNKRALREARGAQKARARRERRLDPPYPFRAEPFDPRLLRQTV